MPWRPGLGLHTILFGRAMCRDLTEAVSNNGWGIITNQVSVGFSNQVKGPLGRFLSEKTSPNDLFRHASPTSLVVNLTLTGIPLIDCKICHKSFRSISHTHLFFKHSLTQAEYIKDFKIRTIISPETKQIL